MADGRVTALLQMQKQLGNRGTMQFLVAQLTGGGSVSSSSTSGETTEEEAEVVENEEIVPDASGTVFTFDKKGAVHLQLRDMTNAEDTDPVIDMVHIGGFRPPGLFGSEHGSHVTAYGVFVDAIRFSIAGQQVSVAVQTMKRLAGEAQNMMKGRAETLERAAPPDTTPSTSTSKPKPPKKRAYENHQVASKRLQDAVTATAESNSLSGLQELIIAYLQYLNSQPLSAVNMATNNNRAEQNAYGGLRLVENKLRSFGTQPLAETEAEREQEAEALETLKTRGKAMLEESTDLAGLEKMIGEDDEDRASENGYEEEEEDDRDGYYEEPGEEEDEQDEEEPAPPTEQELLEQALQDVRFKMWDLLDGSALLSASPLRTDGGQLEGETLQDRQADMVARHLQLCKTAYPLAYQASRMGTARSFVQDEYAYPFLQDIDYDRVVAFLTGVSTEKAAESPAMQPALYNSQLFAVMVELDPEHQDQARDIRVAGRPLGVFGNEKMGSHLTAWSVYVTQVEKAVKGKRLTEGIQSLGQLCDAALRSPGMERHRALAEQVEYQVVGARVEQLEAKVGAKRVQAEAAQGLYQLPALQEYAMAYLELRNALPLSAVDGLSAGIRPLGRGESSRMKKFLTAKAPTNEREKQEQRANMWGLLDHEALAYFASASADTHTAPGLLSDETHHQVSSAVISEFISDLKHIDSTRVEQAELEANQGEIAALLATSVEDVLAKDFIYEASDVEQKYTIWKNTDDRYANDTRSSVLAQKRQTVRDLLKLLIPFRERWKTHIPDVNGMFKRMQDKINTDQRKFQKELTALKGLRTLYAKYTKVQSAIMTLRLDPVPEEPPNPKKRTKETADAEPITTEASTKRKKPNQYGVENILQILDKKKSTEDAVI